MQIALEVLLKFLFCVLSFHLILACCSLYWFQFFIIKCCLNLRETNVPKHWISTISNRWPKAKSIQNFSVNKSIELIKLRAKKLRLDLEESCAGNYSSWVTQQQSQSSDARTRESLSPARAHLLAFDCVSYTEACMGKGVLLNRWVGISGFVPPKHFSSNALFPHFSPKPLIKVACRLLMSNDKCCKDFC